MILFFRRLNQYGAFECISMQLYDSHLNPFNDFIFKVNCIYLVGNPAFSKGCGDA